MKRTGILLLLTFILGTVVMVSLGLGKYHIPLRDLCRFLVDGGGPGLLGSEQREMIHNLVFGIRLPRIIAAVLVGAALSVSGAAFQAMFVNPLVSPGILGVLSGASFGAILAMVFARNWATVQLSAVMGGFLAVAVAVVIARMYRAGSTIMLVLGGIISGAFFTALVSVLKYLADPYNQLPAIVYWLMGNLSSVDRQTLGVVGVPLTCGILVLISLGKQLNVLSMGSEEARTLGMNVRMVRLLVIFFSTGISALTVALAGNIGWVGLIIPHIARLLVGPNNEILLPTSALLGGLYLVIVDDIARLTFTFEIPLGIITSLLGIPFFVFVLRNARKGWQ